MGGSFIDSKGVYKR